MQRHDGTMTGVEALECLVNQLAVGQGARQIGRRRHMDGGELDLDRTSSTTPSQVETGVGDQAMQPGVEAVRVTETRKVAPGADQSVLDGVARELRVPEDEASGRVQPRKAHVDEDGE